MTTHTITPTLRAILRRLFGTNPAVLLISENGHISDSEGRSFHLPTTPHAERGKSWWISNFTGGPREVLAADELIVTADGIVTVKDGERIELQADSADVSDDNLEFLLGHGAPADLVAAIDSLHARTTPTVFQMLEHARSRQVGASALTGMSVRSVGGEIEWATTDRYRCVRMTTPLRTVSKSATKYLESGIVVAGEVVREVARRTEWLLEVHENVAVLSMPSLGVMTVRHLDFDLVRTTSLFPQGIDKGAFHWVFDDAAAAAKVVKSLKAERDNPVVLRADGGGISVVDGDVVPVAESEGGSWAPGELGINPVFLADLLTASVGKGGKAQSSLGEVLVFPDAHSASKPVQVRFSQAPSVQLLLMPVRLW